MGILAWILLGAIAGWIADKITNKKNRRGLLSNMLVGIAGAFVGGYVFESLGGAGITGLNIWSLLVATSGAVLLLIFLRAIQK